MVVIAGFFVFLALVGWLLLTVHASDLTLVQRLNWRPWTFVGSFVRWSVGRFKPGVFTFGQAVVLILGLALFGWLIVSVHWAFGILPLALTVVEAVEARRVLDAMRAKGA